MLYLGSVSVSTEKASREKEQNAKCVRRKRFARLRCRKARMYKVVVA